MPASMISAVTGGNAKVMGSSIAIVGHRADARAARRSACRAARRQESVEKVLERQRRLEDRARDERAAPWQATIGTRAARRAFGRRVHRRTRPRRKRRGREMRLPLPSSGTRGWPRWTRSRGARWTAPTQERDGGAEQHDVPSTMSSGRGEPAQSGAPFPRRRRLRNEPSSSHERPQRRGK